MQHEMQYEINKKRGCLMHPLPASRYKVHNISAIRIVNPFFSYDLANIFIIPKISSLFNAKAIYMP